MTEKAIIYCRVSTEEQAREGYSLEHQEARCRAYCQMAGLEVADVVHENGVSGGKPLAERPGGSRACQGAQGAGNVVALKLDRLFRDTVDALSMVKYWDKAGVALHLVDMGGQTLNTASAVGRFFLSMLASVAELERGLISERISGVMGHLKANGKVYGPTPFGYDRDGGRLVPNRKEQIHIKHMRYLRDVQGSSLRQIAADLERKGVPTKNGGRWAAATVKYILENS